MPKLSKPTDDRSLLEKFNLGYELDITYKVIHSDLKKRTIKV